MYSSIKVIYIIIIISERLVFPQYVHEEDARHSTYLDEKWKKLMWKYCLFLDADKILFVGVNTDWFTTC